MFAVSILHLGQASAQTTVTWDRGANTNNVNDALNWTTDTLPTGSTLGIIDNSIVNPATVALNATLTDYNLRLDAGTLASGTRIFEDTTLVVKGGVYNLSGRLTMSGTTTVTIDGGALTGITNGADFSMKPGSTFNVMSGSAAVKSFFDSAGGANFTVNVSGGILTLAAFTLRGIANTEAGENSTVLRITGGATSTTDAAAATRIADGGRVEFGVGAGTLSLASAPIFAASGSISNRRGFFDFLEDSGGSLTIDGFTKPDYETWWTAPGIDNRLRYKGTNTGNFDDVFKVTGATIVLVPEPAALGLAAVVSALSGLVAWRRRRG